MTTPWEDWDHVLKVDPDKSLVDGETFDDVCETGTDAIEVGGTLDVTTEKMQRVIDACRKHDVPLYQEPSNPAVVVDDDALDGYLVPVVLNAGDPFWITGAHKEWVRIADLDWERTTTEAYIVLNPEASVAEYTEADCDLGADDVAAYAAVADRLFGQEIVYVEYSGMLGEPDVVAAAADARSTTRRCSTAVASATTTRPTRWASTPTRSSSETCSTRRASTPSAGPSRASRTPTRTDRWIAQSSRIDGSR